MKLLIILSLAFFISSCGGGKDNSSTYSCPNVSQFKSDKYIKHGIVIKEQLDHSDRVFLSVSEIENIYSNVEKCVADNNTPGPYLEFKSFNHMGLPSIWGAYMAVGQTVFINTDNDTIAERNCHSDRATLKHEFVHHILYMNGLDNSHQNEAFSQCNALGPKVCDGVACP